MDSSVNGSFAPIMYDRTYFEPVMTRLKKMREKSQQRSTSNRVSLLDRVKLSSVSSRMEWIKGKVRWFVESEELGKLRAKLEVEKSIGRAYPQMWREIDDGAYRAGVEDRTDKELTPHQKISMEHWRNQVDPMLLEDEYVRHGIPGGKEKTEDVKRFRRQAKHLRLLEIKQTEDIVGTAEELIEQITMICQDKNEEDFAPPDAMPLAEAVPLSN